MTTSILSYQQSWQIWQSDKQKLLTIMEIAILIPIEEKKSSLWDTFIQNLVSKG